jgi:hypothetical protein
MNLHVFLTKRLHFGFGFLVLGSTQDALGGARVGETAGKTTIRYGLSQGWNMIRSKEARDCSGASILRNRSLTSIISHNKVSHFIEKKGLLVTYLQRSDRV